MKAPPPKHYFIESAVIMIISAPPVQQHVASAAWAKESTRAAVYDNYAPAREREDSLRQCFGGGV
jgi:hypothetical protein